MIRRILEIIGHIQARLTVYALHFQGRSPHHVPVIQVHGPPGRRLGPEGIEKEPGNFLNLWANRGGTSDQGMATMILQ
jgi:hypothetical protein